MAQSRKIGKTVIVLIIGLILASDAVLAVVNWRLSLSPASSMEDQIRALRRERDLLSLDRKNGDTIRHDLPAVQKECDDFFQQQLRPTEGGYSAISSDLGAIAKESGLLVESTRFRQKAVEKHGVDEITIGMTMEGAYPALVSFINSLERSNNFYVLDSLTLDSTAGGTLRLSLELRTYFRS
jgi:Tfp pilus assembly protein PilO